MFASQARAALLRAGRASLGRWTRDVDQDCAAATRDNYARMGGRVDWPDESMNRVMLATFILPMAALYTALRDQGRAEDEAVDTVTRAVLSMVGPERMITDVLVRTDPGRRVYLRTWQAQVALFFSGPRWEVTWRERSRDTAAFDVTRCYVVDTLRELGAAPVAPAFCAYDQALYEGLCPRLRFTRTGTLACGADRCDFLFENLREDPHRLSPAQPMRSQSAPVSAR